MTNIRCLWKARLSPLLSFIVNLSHPEDEDREETHIQLLGVKLAI